MQSFEMELRRIVAREKLQMLLEPEDKGDNTFWMSQSVAPFDGFLLRQEVRHSKFGFRVARYMRSQNPGGEPLGDGSTYGSVSVNHYDWDESYQFYTSIDDFVAAVKSDDYSRGRAQF
jgi:hypothetical protein